MGNVVPEALAIGVVGTGSMGRHHVRLLKGLESAHLVGVFDADPSVAGTIVAEHGVASFSSVEELARDCQALVIAAPTQQHLEIAETAFAHDCHVLVEKPIASTAKQAQKMLDAAGDRIVAVGHVEFYNPATQALLNLNRAPGYVEVQRRSGFTKRSLDIDVIADVMIHDLQLLHELDDTPVVEIRAVGTAALSDKVDIANVRLEFGSGMVANLTASRVSLRKERRLRAFFPQLYCALDFESMTMNQFEVIKKEGAEPEIVETVVTQEGANPLADELEAFVGACSGQNARQVNGAQGLVALQTAEAISATIASRT